MATDVAAQQIVGPLTPASALGTAWRSLWRVGPAAYPLTNPGSHTPYSLQDTSDYHDVRILTDKHDTVMLLTPLISGTIGLKKTLAVFKDMF